MVEDRKVLTKLNECIKENKSVAVVMIVDTGGSTPRGVGSLMLVDDRRERLTSEIFPNVEDLILGNIPESLKSINIDGSTCVVIVTYGHKYDQDALEAVIKSNACYIGMIGSTNKVKTCFENMIAKGYTKEELSKVYTPIGIDLGGETPEEIALSIMAEIQALKHGKNVPHMKD